MVSKITKRTRIRILFSDLAQIRDKHYNSPYALIKFAKTAFPEDVGLEFTVAKFAKNGYSYYFKVVDKKKFMIAKLKYGI